MECFDKNQKSIVFLKENIIDIYSLNDLILFENSADFKKYKYVKTSEKMFSKQEFHFLFFVEKKIVIEIESADSINEMLSNPTVSYIILPPGCSSDNLINKKTVAKGKKKIENIVCHVDLQKINNHNNKTLIEILNPVWGRFIAYNIFNVNQKDFVKMYENVAESLIGRIRLCHPVNDKSTEFSKSRDVKPNPKLYHYFASNTRQPLHTDYSYYELSDSPDWLMLYCMYPSEYGGETQLLSNITLKKILEKYNPDLLSKMHTDITYKYNGIDGDKTHQKQLFDGRFINWNYWQIKKELNSEETMKIREELFEFLEKVIVSGGIYDLSKKWNTGDCVIFNDHLTLHGRSAFLGDRWLKDHAVFSK